MYMLVVNNTHTHTHTQTDTQTCVQLVAPPEEVYFNVEPLERATVPGSRYGHTVCSYKNRVYMYGGRNDEDGSFSRVDCYDISKNYKLVY